MTRMGFPEEPVLAHIELEALPAGRICRRWLHLMDDAAGFPILVPLVAFRAEEPGPVVGIMAGIHGNELNGVSIIHQLFEEVEGLIHRGAILAIPVANVPAYLDRQREFPGGHDLNRLFPGRPDGNPAEIYAHRLVELVLPHVDYLIDLHTASFGRHNAFFVYSDLTDAATASLARGLGPQIIVHGEGGDRTLRSAAAARGIPAITVEVGDPHRFQRALIDATTRGIISGLHGIGVVAEPTALPGPEPVECRGSYWLRTDAGGLLEVFPKVAEYVSEGEIVAQLTDLFGYVFRTYSAPEDGIVVGKSLDPVASTGARILHLGLLAKPPR